MLFQIYGENAGWQLFGWLLVFVGLILVNELARRTKQGGIFCFLILPAGLTVYFIAVAVGASMGAEWALNNPTYLYMNSWFHYAKLYAATIGCIGFMMLKYKWGIGKTHWFKAFPFVIVGINILIAVASDFESGIRGAMALAETGSRWWLSSENVWVYGGWWNWVNGIAGILNILCMTGWWGIYSSKKQQDMLWPDMTIFYIVAYDLWNFEYTYNNLPTHAWYCGLALLLAPTFANAFWNKGGWIQNRANTLALWCMFAQVFPLFQDQGVFATIPVLYVDGVMDPATHPTAADPTMQGVIALLALAANVIVLAIIIKRSIEQKKNPYTNEIFTDTRDFQLAMAARKNSNLPYPGCLGRPNGADGPVQPKKRDCLSRKWGRQSLFFFVFPVPAADKVCQAFSISRSTLRNRSAAGEKIWYFFHTMYMSACRLGSSGRKHSGLSPVTLMMPSRHRAYPIPSSTIRDPL